MPNNEPFFCPETNCFKTFPHRARLNTHICVHMKGEISAEIQEYLDENYFKKYICDTCGKVFTHPFHLRTHIVTHTRKKSLAGCSKSTNLTCPKKECTYTFKQRSNLNAHICNHLNALNEEYSPEIQKYLDTNDFKKYSCGICDKVFTQTVACENHFLSH